MPYITISGAPSILGGSVPPFAGAELAGAAPTGGVFPTQPPDNDAAYATIVGDLVRRVVGQDHVRVVGWGLWNEPDTLPFWTGSLPQFESLYAAVAPAVKAADPSALVGGPEISTATNTQWLNGFINSAESARVPLDFVSFHYYTGSVGTIYTARALIDHDVAGFRASPPPIVVGEWNFNLADRPGAKTEPWGSADYYSNDWGAAFDATSLIAMQRADVIAAVLTDQIPSGTLPPPKAWTLAAPSMILAPGNIYRMWSMLGSEVLPTAGTPPPGTSVLATRRTDGDIVLMLANMHYRRDLSAPITLRLPGVPSGAVDDEYEIDRRHSDAIDAGRRNASLQRVHGPRIVDGSLSLSLPPDSVTLLEIDR
jgi:hypothetical protein